MFNNPIIQSSCPWSRKIYIPLLSYKYMERSIVKDLETKLLTSTLSKRAKGGIISSLAGLAGGVVTTLLFGKEAYNVPEGAAIGGIMTSINLKGKPIDYLTNIGACEAAYYAGVALTDNLLRTLF